MENDATTVELSKTNSDKLTAISSVVGLSKKMMLDNMCKYAFSMPEALGATTSSTKIQVLRMLEAFDE